MGRGVDRDPVRRGRLVERLVPVAQVEDVLGRDVRPVGGGTVLAGRVRPVLDEHARGGDVAPAPQPAPNPRDEGEDGDARADDRRDAARMNAGVAP